MYKRQVFQCDVKKIETKEVPELDDEFAKDVSEFDTLAEYKEDVKKKLTEKKENCLLYTSHRKRILRR